MALYRDDLRELSAYVPGEKRKRNASQTIFRMASNENPLGCSPDVMRVIEDQANIAAVYPDSAALKLRETLAERYDLETERLLCGAGSDELLHLIATACLEKGTEAIHSGFLIYPIVTRTARAKPVRAPEVDECVSVEGILQAVNDTTRLVFLANPNNPTGTAIDFASLCTLHAQLPENVLLVIDAAYAEYVGAEDDERYRDGIELARRENNVVVTRTFSKIYGLAGLRLGWLYGPPELCAILNRIRGPFNVSSLAISAGCAALADQDFVRRSAAYNRKWRGVLRQRLAHHKIRTTPSLTNFVLAHFGERLPQGAQAFKRFLGERGVSVRSMDAYDLPDALRVSVGSVAGNEAFAEALDAFCER